MYAEGLKARRLVGRYGCEDCGQLWSRKGDVPRECQPYTYRVERDDSTMSGYAFSSDEDPRWSE